MPGGPGWLPGSLWGMRAAPAQLRARGSARSRAGCSPARNFHPVCVELFLLFPLPLPLPLLLLLLLSFPTFGGASLVWTRELCQQ